jgi:hypothetical protein
MIGDKKSFCQLKKRRVCQELKAQTEEDRRLTPPVVTAQVALPPDYFYLNHRLRAQAEHVRDLPEWFR